MFHAKMYRFFLGSVCLIVGRFLTVHSQFNLNPTDILKTVQDPLTQDMCNLRTNELIEYYGYLAEEHNVITEDGYNLTIFRCNSKSRSLDKKKVVVIHHGFFCSSDDFCMNNPSRALAYVLADAGYDVWLSNARGSFYARRHITLSPSDEQFWNFSWDTIAIYDYPAVFDYVMAETKQSKVYTVAHSQGTTCMMTLLSEQPEYNDKIIAASLMAPVGYVKHVGPVYQTLEKFHKILEKLSNTELLPRGIASESTGTICGLGLQNVCQSLLEEFIFGQSEEQKNETLLPIFLCHAPSGASFNQLFHYGSEVSYDYFGKYMNSSEVPPDFDLSQITAPISLHYSLEDILATAKDIEKLIPKLNNCLARVQLVNQTKFDHNDFIWGNHAAEFVYTEILSFFKEHQ